MKKITTIGLVAFAALSYSTTSLADTPAVREMNSYDHILAVAMKNRALTNNASEFVIYHQDSGRPCPHGKAKGKHEHEGKKEGKHHHHHHHHKDDGKATKPVHHKKADDTQKPKTDDTATPTTGTSGK